MEIIQYFKGNIIPDVYKRHMLSVIHNRPPDVGYRFMDSNSYNLTVKSTDYRFESDIVRCLLASDNPQMVWMDSDMLLKSWWAPPTDYRPYFYNLGGQPDICMFFVNGNTQFFRDAYKFYRDNHVNDLKCGWFMFYIMNIAPSVSWGYIPREGHFIHKGLGGF